MSENSVFLTLSGLFMVFVFAILYSAHIMEQRCFEATKDPNCFTQLRKK